MKRSDPVAMGSKGRRTGQSNFFKYVRTRLRKGKKVRGEEGEGEKEKVNRWKTTGCCVSASAEDIQMEAGFLDFLMTKRMNVDVNDEKRQSKEKEEISNHQSDEGKREGASQKDKALRIRYQSG